MKKLNKDNSGCKDVFHAFLVEKVRYAGKYDFPVIKEEHIVPRRCILFSDAIKEKNDYAQWVVFYEYDYLFERVWNNPKKYIEILKRFEGVVSPDFSVYYDMPFAMQIWNIYRSRVIGAWLQNNGIRVIPNIRYGIDDTFDIVCDGISKHSVISIGSLGCIKKLDYRSYFEKGLEYIARKLEPETIFIYGCAPQNTKEIKKLGINVVIYKPEFFHSRKGVK